MAIYNYGIGGNEVKVDANESIAEIPSNRTLIVQKLALQKALENPEVKNAIMDVIESSIEEILANQKKVEL